MAVSAYLFLALMCAVSGKPMMEDGAEAPDPTVGDIVTSPEPSSTTEIIEAVESPKNCTTALQHDGTCVQRALCEYSTSAIDFTLYAPRGYVKTCKEDEVCCPLEHVVVHKDTTNDSNSPNLAIDNNNDAGFEFDDND